MQRAEPVSKERPSSNAVTNAEVSYTAGTDRRLQVASWNDGSSHTTEHDIRGNLTCPGDGRDFYYDHENRLVHIDSESATGRWFRYNALGRRVAEREGSSDERLFYYDGARIVEETDENLNVDRLSIFGIRLDEALYSGGWTGSALTSCRARYFGDYGQIEPGKTMPGPAASVFSFPTYLW